MPTAEPPGQGRRGSRRGRRRWPVVLVAVTVVVVLVLAAVAYRLDLLDPGGGAAPLDAPDPTLEPAAVPPPPELDLPEPAAARPVAAALTGDAAAAVDPAAVRRALGSLPDARRLGPRVAVAVAGLDGRPVLESGPRAVVPASTLKVLVSTAALSALGTEHRFVTRTVRSGRVLTLVGGGDPLLARRPPEPGTLPVRADLRTLARETAEALAADGRDRVRLRFDDSLFTGPAASPSWEPTYLPDDVVSPVQALWTDEGREEEGLSARSADPAAAAALVFARALRDEGVTVTGRPERAVAADGAAPVAEVAGAELVEVVQHVLEVSDNEGAEVLARHVALARDRPASFAGAAAAVTGELRELGIGLDGADLSDGSGLSRSDRLPPRVLLEVFAAAARPEHAELSGVLEGLPVAGFSGSLSSRFEVGADAGLGFVRAKTGTLTGVHGLAGVVVARDGTVLLFVAVADRVKERNTLFARAQLDRIAASLAACRCGRRP